MGLFTHIAQSAGAVVCCKKNEYPVYDTKQSDCEVPVMLELWGMQTTPSLPSLPGPFWPEVVVPDRVLSIGQIELNYILILN